MKKYHAIWCLLFLFLSPASVLASETYRTICSESSSGSTLNYKGDEELAIRIDANGSVQMSTDSRGAVDADGYMSNGRPFSSQGRETVLWVRRDVNGLRNSDSEWRRNYGYNICEDMGGREELVPGGGAYSNPRYDCHQALGRESTISLLPQERVRLYVRDSYYNDNSGCYDVRISW